MLGKKGTTKCEIPLLAKITVGFVEYFLDHPTENVLASFEKIAK